MANHASSKKRIRRNARCAAVNTARRSRLRTFVKKVEMALTAGNVEQAGEALRMAQPEIDRSVAKGLMHKNAAARKMSRLSARIKALKKSA